MSAGRCKVDMSDGHQYLLVGVKATAIGWSPVSADCYIGACCGDVFDDHVFADCCEGNIYKDLLDV